MKEFLEIIDGVSLNLFISP